MARSLNSCKHDGVMSPLIGLKRAVPSMLKMMPIYEMINLYYNSLCCRRGSQYYS